jgi:hypothetical protein
MVAAIQTGGQREVAIVGLTELGAFLSPPSDVRPLSRERAQDRFESACCAPPTRRLLSSRRTFYKVSSGVSRQCG